MRPWIDRCHFGDCRDLLRAMIADGVRVQMVVTSPPYWRLRSYLPKDHPDKHREIGREPTLGEFIDTLVDVFELCRALLTDDGTAWVNMGDSYAANRSYQVRGTRGARGHTFSGPSAVPPGLKPKDLIGQPWHLAFALQNAGWYLRQDIIYHKRNPMPESVRDRCTKAHEYLFLLANHASYYFNASAIAQPLAPSSIARLSQPTLAHQQGSDRVPGKSNGRMKAVGARFGGTKYGDDDRGEFRTKSGNDWANATGRANRRSVWSLATQSYRGAHFATFPEALVEPCILAGSRRGDLVLDPFFGSGTVGVVARRLQRHYIGCELNRAHDALQRERLCLDESDAFD
ncbi:site-specific DNA-methyltransferase [Burkholderia sp. Bp9012]|uniref:DNA-methyltransferase n=1 Tax=Burkholderia sp. Bp9012 TaxID=2184562 RepID=UPI000F5ABB3E|nr:site-specific DNA-methyltransferase [Burkholderia sp. Bp9012]RQR79201.1 site-specific DNA-methyltransferase [Burkholderia sp. Bp9012]